MSKQEQNRAQPVHPYTIVGTPRAKVDAYAKVTGRAVYADDILLPRMLYGRILRSPHAHARILSIDTSRAKKLPGVLAIITGEDLPQKFGILPSSQDEYALAIDKVRYVGDPVVAIAALDPDILVDFAGMTAATFPLLSQHPARQTWTIAELPYPAPLVDRTFADFDALARSCPFNSMAPGSVRKTVVTLSSDPV